MKECRPRLGWAFPPQSTQSRTHSKICQDLSTTLDPAKLTINFKYHSNLHSMHLSTTAKIGQKDYMVVCSVGCFSQVDERSIHTPHTLTQC